MGRPANEGPRDRQLNLSLTASEYDAVSRRAQALGLRPGHFGRVVLLEAKDKVVRPTYSEDSPLTRLLYNQVIRLGSNLNQMVRHLHSTGDPLPRDLEPLLKDIRAIIARVRE